MIYLLVAVFLFWNYLKFYKRQALDIYFLFLSIQSEKNNVILEGSKEITDPCKEFVDEVGEK
jgi:hypothetical protein